MAATTLTLRELNRATLARQMLLAREKATVARAIERLVGIQAQWPKPPFIALWSRIQGFKREELTKAVLRREVVRATLMRCTLHLMTGKDYLALRPALQPVLDRAMGSILKDRGKGIDLERLVAEARAYFDEEPRTFDELRGHLLALHPKADERAMGYAVRTQLPLVQVPTDTAWGYPAAADFAVAESWLGEPLPSSASGPQALVLRYLAALGPASIADVQAWSGLQRLRETVDELRPKLVALRDERGRELFDLPKAPRPTGDVAAPVRFLPDFDNVIVAREGARFVADRHRPLVFLSALRIRSTVLVDGFVVGAWKIERKKAAAALVVEPFEPLSKAAKDAVAEEGDALVRFVEDDATTFELRFAKPPAAKARASLRQRG